MHYISPFSLLLSNEMHGFTFAKSILWTFFWQNLNCHQSSCVKNAPKLNNIFPIFANRLVGHTSKGKPPSLATWWRAEGNVFSCLSQGSVFDRTWAITCSMSAQNADCQPSILSNFKNVNWLKNILNINQLWIFRNALERDHPNEDLTFLSGSMHCNKIW